MAQTCKTLDELRKALRDAIGKSDLSIRKIGTAADVPFSRIAGFNRGEERLSADSLFKLAHFFKIKYKIVLENPPYS